MTDVAENAYSREATTTLRFVAGVCEDADSDTELALSPGANFLFSVGSVFINADLRYNTIMTGGDDGAENTDAIVIGAGVGVAL